MNEVTVSICIHDEGIWNQCTEELQGSKPSPGQSRPVQPCSCCEVDKPSCWPWSNHWLWLSVCECQGSAASSNLHRQLRAREVEWEEAERSGEMVCDEDGGEGQNVLISKINKANGALNPSIYSRNFSMLHHDGPLLHNTKYKTCLTTH